MTINIGAKIQRIKNTPPIIKTIISAPMPINIKNVLIIAPTQREKRLERKVSRNLFMLNPLPFTQLILFHGEKYVFKSNGIEKK